MDRPEQVLGAELEFVGDGSEANVYRLNDSTVAKVISSVYFDDFQQALDRVMLHNAFFPETAMKVTGFGRNSYGDLSVIVEQPYVEGVRVKTDDVEKLTSDFGMERLEWILTGTEYANLEIYLGDLHDENVLRTPGGNIAVIDCDIRLNTPELGYGGKYSIPKVAFSEESVRKIDEVLSFLVPQKLSTEEALGRFPSLKDHLEDLDLAGRVEGCLQDALTGGYFLIAADPDDKGGILVLPHEAATAMVSLEGDSFSEKEKAILSEGRHIRKGGKEIALNPLFGRIEELPVPESALREKLVENEKERLSRRTSESLRQEHPGQKIK